MFNSDVISLFRFSLVFKLSKYVLVINAFHRNTVIKYQFCTFTGLKFIVVNLTRGIFHNNKFFFTILNMEMKMIRNHPAKYANFSYPV